MDRYGLVLDIWEISGKASFCFIEKYQPVGDCQLITISL